METFTLEQVCEMMHTSRKTIMPWIESGLLPAIMVGNRYTFTPWDVIKFQKMLAGHNLASHDDLMKLIRKHR